MQDINRVQWCQIHPNYGIVSILFAHDTFHHQAIIIVPYGHPHSLMTGDFPLAATCRQYMVHNATCQWYVPPGGDGGMMGDLSY